MNRTQFSEHAGRRIVYMNFAGVDDVEEGLRVIEQARLFVAAQPKQKNLLTLVNVEKSKFDDRIVQALKQLAKHDQPWVMAGAVVGMSPLQRVIYRVINAFSGPQESLSFFVFDQATDSSPFAGPRAWTAALTLVAIVLTFTVVAKLLARRNKLAR